MTPIDPDDPPVFESEAAYLKRLNLFMRRGRSAAHGSRLRRRVDPMIAATTPSKVTTNAPGHGRSPPVVIPEASRFVLLPVSAYSLSCLSGRPQNRVSGQGREGSRSSFGALFINMF